MNMPLAQELHKRMPHIVWHFYYEGHNIKNLYAGSVLGMILSRIFLNCLLTVLVALELILSGKKFKLFPFNHAP